MWKPDGLLQKIHDSLARWDVPSVSVCAVRDGQVLFAGGIGARDGALSPADGKTIYEIASCTKAFTAAAAGVLATEGKLDFDAPVIEYMPDFRLSDLYAQNHLTVRDFLSHRSGLPRHEYAWYGTGFTREELYRNLRYLSVNAPIRYRFQYSNFNYFIAGCLIERISGMKIEDFLKEKLLSPLGMDRSYTRFSEIRRHRNSALAFDHAQDYTMSGVREIPYYASPAENDAAGTGDPTAAAGCILSCAEDMGKWLLFNLNGGLAGGREIVKKEYLDLIRSPHIYIGADPDYSPERGPVSYALGWEYSIYRGRPMVQHGGNINGFSSSMALLPEDGTGVFVSANMNVTLLADAVALEVLDELAGAEDGRWTERLYRANEALFAHVREVYAAGSAEPVPGTHPSHDPSAYAGDYEAPGYRRFRIEEKDGRLTADFNTFRTALRHWQYDSFVTESTVGELPAGLLITFGLDAAGTVRSLQVKLGSEQGLEPMRFIRKEEKAL